MLKKNKNIILISGICGDIGSYLAKHFLKKGFLVLGLDINPNPPLGLRGLSNLHIFECDLTDAEAVSLQVEMLTKLFGRISILINNGGLIFSHPVISYTDGKIKGHNSKDWDRVLYACLSSAFYLSTAFVEKAVGEKGVIINISSISANGNPGQSAYSAAKGGMNSLTLSMAKELGPLGIRVAAIAPGFFDTQSTHNALNPDIIKKIKKMIPLRRLGSLVDLASAVDFIVENNYFSGAILELNGGLSI